MSSSIFHEGPLDTAITSAVQKGIYLVFFVTDNGEQSSQWETIYLQSPEILPLLQKQSIILRLQQGSTEAAFLAAFCPAQKVPYLVVVKNGALVASIPSDVSSRGEFIQRIQSTFSGQDSANNQSQDSSSSNAFSPSSPRNPTATLFAERKARLEAQEAKRRQREKEEREQRIAREKARREAESPARTKYVEEQRKLREVEKAEKQRILRLVEDDKIERRVKEERKKQSKLAHQHATSPEKAPEPGPLDSETAISFRLLDGTILKSKFPSSSKLADVRRWLDLNRTDDASPYSFQQVFPNKSLSASDEESSLTDLSFSHATTLVLVHHNE